MINYSRYPAPHVRIGSLPGRLARYHQGLPRAAHPPDETPNLVPLTGIWNPRKRLPSLANAAFTKRRSNLGLRSPPC